MSHLSMGSAWIVPPFPVRRFTVDEYHRMIQTGILAEDERVELIEGWITPKMPRNPPHDAFIDQAAEVLHRHLPPGWRVRVQSAITTPDSEPEPDLAIVPGPASRYRNQHPGPADVAVVIEVADSSLASDRGTKGPLYARVSIPIYWIINLVDQQLEVYTDPTGPGTAPHYRQRQDYTVNDQVPLILAGQIVAQIPGGDLLA
jgi:hypothetical protein